MDYEQRSSEVWDDVRFTIEDGGSGLTMDGPMALYGVPSVLLSERDLLGESRAQLSRSGKRTFREIIEPGAFHKSLAESPDIVLHYQHDERSLPLGRTKAGTLRLTEEAGQVRAQADLPDNEWGRPVRDAVKRGDIGGVSFRMGKVLERWNFDEALADGYRGPVRHLQEVRLRREVSLVTFPGYDTPATVRELAEIAAVDVDDLAQAFAVLRSADQKLTPEQRDLLVTTLNARTDAPVVDASAAIKLADMRERLAALAAG